MLTFFQSDLRSPATVADRATHLNKIHHESTSTTSTFATPARGRVTRLNAVVSGGKVADKPSICTADELHYVSVPNSGWRLALWRYLPSSQGSPRNHPLLLLSGVGTNATGYDLAPGSSFARYMSGQGYDTWILEVRGAGLSTEDSPKGLGGPLNRASSSVGTTVEHPFRSKSSKSQSDIDKALATSDVSANNGHRPRISTISDEFQLKTKAAERLDNIYHGLPGSLSDDMMETKQISIANQFSTLRQKLAYIIQEGQQSISPHFGDLPKRFSLTVEDFHRQLQVIVKYNWDFDHYLEEDVPTAMDYIRAQCQPRDGKLLAIGHSMGGILLYAMLSRGGQQGRNSEFASVVTLGSSLDFTTSRSSLKLLLPLVDPAQVLNVPVIPLGSLLAAAYPLASRPPYILSWLNSQISAQDMMHPEMFEKLVLKNFCTIPAKLLLQLSTVFREGGLCDRSRMFFYKDSLHKNEVPVLALAGDQDLICPPEAVYETVKLLPEHLITHKVFGEPGGPHYAHYDLVGGRRASDQVYPCIIEFLSCHDAK